MTRITVKSRSGKHSAECDAELFARAEKILGEESARWALWVGGERRLTEETDSTEQHQKTVADSRREPNCPVCGEKKIECYGCELFKCAECEIDESSSQCGGWWCAACVAAGEHQNPCDGCSNNFDHDELSGIATPWGVNDFCDECEREYYHRAANGFFSAASCDGFKEACIHRNHEDRYHPDCKLCAEEVEDDESEV